MTEKFRNDSYEFFEYTHTYASQRSYFSAICVLSL